MRRLVIKADLGFEYWKPIQGYENYQISTYGRVRRNGKVLKHNPDRNGYHRVVLFKKGEPKTKLVHRLVAEAFLPSPTTEQTVVNHIDENKDHNSIKNIEWASVLYNQNYGTRNDRIRIANYKPVLQLDLQGNFIAKFPSAIEASKTTGADRTNISKCCKGQIKSSGGFKWSYCS